MIRSTAFAALMATGITAFAAEDAKFKPDLLKAKAISESICVACHAADGNSTTPANPILAGQGAEYLFKQLKDYKPLDGKPALRNNPTMAGMTATLTTDDMKSLAVFFSQQKIKPATASNEKLVEAGKLLWRKGDFERGIPACAGCHGPAGAGIPAQFPRLAGQHADYTAAQLKNFRSEDRSNDPQGMMRMIADKLSDKQIKALADYIAGLR